MKSLKVSILRRFLSNTELESLIREYQANSQRVNHNRGLRKTRVNDKVFKSRAAAADYLKVSSTTLGNWMRRHGKDNKLTMKDIEIEFL